MQKIIIWCCLGNTKHNISSAPAPVTEMFLVFTISAGELAPLFTVQGIRLLKNFGKGGFGKYIAIPLSGDGSRCAVCPDNCPMFHPEWKYVTGYDGGVYADSMHGGHFKGVRSNLIMKTDTASRDAREEFYTYLWSGEGSSSQRRTHGRDEAKKLNSPCAAEYADAGMKLRN